jgi:hemerythrin
MGRFVWDESNLVGVSSIDEQHRKLGELIDRLDDRIAARAGLADLRAVFDDLQNCAEIHFLDEERLFGRAPYDRAARHKREHDSLLLILKRFQQGLDAAAISESPAEHVAFLRGWLIRHIRSEDKPLGIHLNSLGIR